MRGVKASLGDLTDVAQIVEKVHVTSDRKVCLTICCAHSYKAAYQ